MVRVFLLLRSIERCNVVVTILFLLVFEFISVGFFFLGWADAVVGTS